MVEINRARLVHFGRVDVWGRALASRLVTKKHEDVSKVHTAIIPSNLHGIWHANPYLTSFDIQHPDLLHLECFQLF